ncbi:MAG: spermidine synthase [Roseiarcus sp.]|jgi:spermidine synthase|uniref:spermidine synthase n=1 Tax=Roseiarcus sp. TaxID=1969460 RepID=UPI003BB05CD4
MIPWIELDRAALPHGGELRLMRRGHEFSIKLGVAELMTSRLFASEEALATLAAEKLRGRTKPRVLIGGLGMGFTLRAALSAFGAHAEIVVAELVPAVVRWARGPMAELFGGSLDDRRVELVEADVAALIRRARPLYDAILLDVDNGPEGMTQSANDHLYSLRGLAVARAALSPGGVLAVWSQGPDPAFAKRFEKAGFSVEEKMVRARGARGGSRHVIWLGAPK